MLLLWFAVADTDTQLQQLPGGMPTRGSALHVLLLLAALTAVTAARYEVEGPATTQPFSVLGPLPALARRLFGLSAPDAVEQDVDAAVGRKLLISTGNSTCSVRPTQVLAMNKELRAEATMSLDYGTGVIGYFRMRFVDCSPSNSSICSMSSSNGQQGVFEVGRVTASYSAGSAVTYVGWLTTFPSTVLFVWQWSWAALVE